MTDTEILDWLERERPTIGHYGKSGNWVIDDGQVRRLAPTLREAVEKAARENGDGA